MLAYTHDQRKKWGAKAPPFMHGEKHRNGDALAPPTLETSLDFLKKGVAQTMVGSEASLPTYTHNQKQKKLGSQKLPHCCMVRIIVMVMLAPTSSKNKHTCKKIKRGGGARIMVGNEAPLLTYTHNQKKKKKRGAKTPSLLHNKKHNDGSIHALFHWK